MSWLLTRPKLPWLQVLEAPDGRLRCESLQVPRCVEELLCAVIDELRKAIDVPVEQVAARQHTHQGPMFHI
jgi:hypothetical protein